MSLVLLFLDSSASGITGTGSADGYIPTVAGVGERTIIALSSIDGIVPTLAGVGERIITGAGSADGLISLVTGTVDVPGQFIISTSIRVKVSDQRVTLGAVNDDPIAKYVNIQGL